jgi:hypothetical protein
MRVLISLQRDHKLAHSILHEKENILIDYRLGCVKIKSIKIAIDYRMKGKKKVSFQHRNLYVSSVVFRFGTT